MPSSSGPSSGLQQFRVKFETNPILLVGGVAKNMSGVSGGMLPLASVTQSGSFSDGVTGGSSAGPDEFNAHFSVQAGGQLINNQVAHYPLANQVTAANAVITQPLGLTVLMTFPATGENGGYSGKQALFTSLKSTLDQHTALGGTYTVATPAYVYAGCLLLTFEDVSNAGMGEQVQNVWRWTFEQPLLTLQQAQAVQNNVMAKTSSLTQMSGDPPTGQLQAGVGQPGSGLAGIVIPAAGSSGGAAVSPQDYGSGLPSSGSPSPVGGELPF